MRYVDIFTQPDSVMVADEKSPFRWEEANEPKSKAKVTYEVKNNVGSVVIHPYEIPVKYIKLRWNQPTGIIERLFSDQWERSGGAHIGMENAWTGVIPHKRMPWYFHCVTGDKNALYGVKTGANAFCYWQMDSKGLTLFIDATCGCDGTLIKKPLTLCQTVSYFAEGDSYYAAKTFCTIMCDKPVNPTKPIFGVNNWYWAYGNISHESVMDETNYLLEMTHGVCERPYMILDDGWQISRTYSGAKYNGGPWNNCNDKFNSMAETAAAIIQKGANPGIWLRPLQTIERVPDEAVIHKGEITVELELDPSHPYTLEKVRTDVKRIADWGFKLIKHDFSSIDITGNAPAGCDEGSFCRRGVHFFDRTKTTAQIVKDYYNAVQAGAGDNIVIGCNTFGHLVAGIHACQRVGNDTSGRSFEWTVRFGLSSMMRLPQNDTFFNVDPDCAPFTERVPHDKSLDFLEICALTGMTTLASVQPHSLSSKDMQRINAIYKLAAQNGQRYSIADYNTTCVPEKFVSADGKDVKEYDWYDYYGGTRSMLSWME